MGEKYSGLIEMSLVFGSVLALAIFELVSLRRARRRDEQKSRSNEHEKI